MAYIGVDASLCMFMGKFAISPFIKPLKPGWTNSYSPMIRSLRMGPWIAAVFLQLDH